MTSQPHSPEASPLKDLVQQAVEQFRRSFGYEPDCVAYAPGRINLIGDHVDYEGGLVLPMAINRCLVLAAGKRGGQQTDGLPPLRGISAHDGKLLQGTVSREDEGWLRYVAGMVSGYRGQGWEKLGLDFSLVSSLPIGAGLSSSAALELACAMALEGLGAPALSPNNRALLGQQVEHEYLGVPCGIMDQLAVGQGKEAHALLIDCQTLLIEPVPLPENAAFLVIDSGVEHELAASEYPKRRQQCSKAARLLELKQLSEASLAQIENKLGHEPLLAQRATHVVEEIARVREFARCLAAAELERAGELMTQSHASLRDLFEVSCAEVDALVAGAVEMPEVLGARMTGGGFGGSVICLMEAQKADFVLDKIRAFHAKSLGYPPRAFVAKAEAGAQLLTS